MPTPSTGMIYGIGHIVGETPDSHALYGAMPDYSSTQPQP